MNAEHVPGDAQESNSTHAPVSDSSPPADRGDSGSDSTSASVGFGAGLEAGGAAQKSSKKKRTRKKSAKPTRRKKAAPRRSAAKSGEPDEAAEPGEKRASGSRSRTASRTAARTAAKSDAAQKEASEEASEESAARDEARTRKKSTRKRSRSRKKPARADADSGEEADVAASAEPDSTAPETDGDRAGAEDREGDGDDASGGKKRRRRGRRGGRRRRGKRDEDAATVETLPGEEDDLPELPEQAELLEGEGDSDEDKGGKRKRKRSRRRKGSTKEGDDDPAPERGRGRKKAKAGKAAKKSRRRKSKEDEPEKSPEELAAEVEAARTQVILVNAVDLEEKRVAVVDDGRIADFLMTSESQKTLVNDIYRGKVVNLETAIGAAFIDFGQGRNGFLHTSDVLAMYGEKGFTLDSLLTSKIDPEDWDETSQPDVGPEVDDDDDDDGDEEASAGGKKKKTKKRASARGGNRRGRRRERERRPISDLLKVGDLVAVQVTKDAIGDKGPTLTTYISIPGRYLVLMPSMARTGVSRKISDEKERRRLKKILGGLKGTTDMGVIVRTAGIGKTKTDLQRDLDYLRGVWASLSHRLKHGRGPAPLYQESDVAVRTLRDLFNARTKRVIVDDPMVHEQLLEFAEKLMPDQIDRIVMHDGDRPVFHHHGIEQDFEKIFARRVDLPSGGSIVFDQAEALVAIDVNSGRTRTDSFDFEEIALKTNLEAVPEIARQIKLRDLGGILVCDFIDMQRTSSNRTVERALRQALAEDRARSKLGRISQFGLLEMTRQRLGPGTHKKVFQTCPRCRGTARIRTVQSRAAAILRRLGSALAQKGFSSVELRAHPEVVTYLKEDLYDYIRALEHRFEREISLVSVTESQQVEDSVLRYLRADGREVRPGGRRKR